MTYRVKILRRAVLDVHRIVEYLAIDRQSPQGARSWYIAYEDALARLSESAGRMPVAPEDEFVEYEIRHMVFKTKRGHRYRLLYTIIEAEARILHVRGAEQDQLSADEVRSPNDS